MSAGFGHEIAGLTEDFAAHPFRGVVFGLLEALAQQGVQVASAMLQPQEPRHMVDARAFIDDFAFGNVGVARDQVERGLHAVAQTHIADAGIRQRPANRRHGIDIIEQQRVRAAFPHIRGQRAHDRDGAQRTENAAGAERVADALIHAVAHGNFHIGLIGGQPADLKRADDKIRAAQRLAAVGGQRGGGVQPVGRDDAVHERLDRRGAAGGGRHQRKVQAADAGNLKDV